MAASPSLTLAEARTRAGLVADVRTSLHLDLTGREDFGCRAEVRFSGPSPGSETFLELADATDVQVSFNGAPLEGAYDGHRIALPGLAAENVVEVGCRLPYVTDGDGMHTVTDPADGERYSSAYLGMDVAQKVFPCFDQPDLKTTIDLAATAPEHWTVVANGAAVEHGGGRWRFATTPPVSSYLFVVCGGPWASVTWTEDVGNRALPFGWYARASLAAELERDAAELREITSRCFAHYTRVFDEPYPFDSYDQVLVPGQNWGALETPGAVTFRDELLFRGTPTAMQRQSRATVIAHEMAHMWFGDLVTMRWWEDTWLNESFADYMGYQVSDVAAGYGDAWISCAIGRKPTAYRADRRRSTHPVAAVAEDVTDVDTAFGNFDMITYAKGNAVLRQLVTWLGEDAFLAGANGYLSSHPFGNAELADFLGALDAATDRDVRGWADAWLGSTGFDRIAVERDGDVPLLTREGTRPHRFTVTAYDDELAVVGSRTVDLADRPLRLEEWAGRVVLPNTGDETLAALDLDERAWAAVRGSLSSLEDPLTRAVLWWTAVDAAEGGSLPVPELVALAAAHLTQERHPVVFEGAVAAVARVVRRQAYPEDVPALVGELTEVAGRVLRDADDRVPAAARALAEGSTDAGLLAGWLDGTSPLPDADQEVRWSIVHRLAELGDDSRVEPELARDRSSAGEQGALRARAAVPATEAKQAAWTRLMGGELSNREFVAVGQGFWGQEQADLTRPWLTRYATDGLALGRRSGQAFGRTIGLAFPWQPLPDADLTALRTSLAAVLEDGDGEPVPTVLRRSWEDQVDDLDRVIASRRA
jgi:aminopeptidase N